MLAIAVFCLVWGGRGDLAAQGRNTFILGRVVEGLTKSPVGNAVVRLAPASGGIALQLTLATDDGEFVFANVPVGKYRLAASQDGYWWGDYGQRRLGGAGQLLEVSAAGTGPVDVPVWATSAVEGTVRDEAGEPLVGLKVEAITSLARAGRWQPAAAAVGVTDDRGHYRIAGLTGTSYVLAVRPVAVSAPGDLASAPASNSPWPLAELNLRGLGFGQSGSSEVLDVVGATVAFDPALTPPVGERRWYGAVFFPGAETFSTADAVTLERGQTRRGVDLTMVPVSVWRVSGRLVSPDARGVGNLPVRLYRRDVRGEADLLETAVAFSDSQGGFVFPAVPAGQFELRVFDAVPMQRGYGRFGATTARETSMRLSVTNSLADGAPARWAAGSISVGTADVDDVLLAVQEGMTISGQIVIEGRREMTDQERGRLRFLLEDQTGGPAGEPARETVLLESTGAFRTIGLPPGRYFARLRALPAGWAVKSVTLTGQDVMDRAVELRNVPVDGLTITVVDVESSLTFNVTDAQGSADDTATVLVFPASSSSWSDFGRFSPRFRSGRVDAAGVVTVRGLPAGEYRAVAVDDAVAEDWELQERLQELAGAASLVTLSYGEQKSVTLRREGGR